MVGSLSLLYARCLLLCLIPAEQLHRYFPSFQWIDMKRLQPGVHVSCYAHVYKWPWTEHRRKNLGTSGGQ